jgi:hypothetical protein
MDDVGDLVEHHERLAPAAGGKAVDRLAQPLELVVLQVDLALLEAAQRVTGQRDRAVPSGSGKLVGEAEAGTRSADGRRCGGRRF